MAQLRELFSDLFAYVLLFEQTAIARSDQPSFDQLREGVRTLLDQQEAAAHREGIPTPDYLEARFAVLAWVDETILKYPDWEGHAQWGAMPLQLEYYQMRNAGHELSERLERLQPDQTEVREIYLYCLGLGFSGRYALEAEGERNLHRIRREQAQHIALPNGEMQDIGQLTSQPYEIDAPKPAPVTNPWTRRLLALGIGILVVVPLLLFMAYKFWPVQTKKTVVQKPPAEKPTRPQPQTQLSPPPLAERVVQWLEAHPNVLACSQVAEQVEADTGAVTLSGRVASEDNQNALLAGLRELEGVERVDSQLLEIIPRPFCEVLAVLEPVKAQADAQGAGISARLSKAGVRPVFFQGDPLLIEIQTPATSERTLYIDYYTTTGEVGRLLPSASWPDNTYDAGEAVTFGALQGPKSFTIQPPGGLEMVTIIASRAGLISMPDTGSGEASPYIEQLRQALDGAAASELAATYMFLINRSSSP